MKKDKKLKGRIETTNAKANQALNVAGKVMDEVYALRKENRTTFTQIMYGGILIFLGAFLYDFIARLLTHKYTEGWGRDQLIVMGIGIIIALWGAWRKK